MKLNPTPPSDSGIKLKSIPPFYFVAEFEVSILFSNSIIEEMGNMNFELLWPLKYVSCLI